MDNLFAAMGGTFRLEVRDTRAAAAAGLRGVLLDRHGREAIPPDVVAIKSLSDVLTLMGERQDG